MDIEVNIERLDSEIIDEHLRSSTAVLHDILNDELKRDIGNSSHMCLQCGKFYKTATSLNMHHLLKHPKDQIVVKCALCDKEYPSMMSLQKHVRYMHRYSHRCKTCYKTFPTIEHLSDHMLSCSKMETPCEECGKIFDSSIALRNHNKYKHPESMTNSCELCRRTFTSSRSLSNHMAAIHPPSATSCKWCHRTFNSLPGLQSHILYKHKTDGSKCVFCCKLFGSSDDLYNHLRKTHFTNKNSYHCGICRNKFKTAKAVVKHVLAMHTENNIGETHYNE